MRAHAGANDVEAVQGCFGCDALEIPPIAEVVVGDLQPEVLADLVAADDLAHPQPSPILALEPTGPAGFDHLVQLALGRQQQVLALAPPVLSQGRVLTHHQPLTGEPGFEGTPEEALVCACMLWVR